MRNAAMLAVFGLGLLTSCGAFEGKDQAEKAVVAFHEQFNSERYGDIYTEADADFRRATSLGDLTQLLQAVRRKLGTFTKASQTGSNVFAGTNGTTVTLVYSSEYTEGKATEQFKYSISGGKAFLLGYNINSPALILK